MPRYIDANVLISDSRICGNCKDYELCDGNIAFCPNASARRAINNAPTADVEPVKHGRWIRGVSKGFPKNPTCLWYCSCCGEKIRYVDTLRRYQKIKKPVNEANPRCRKCGAKMSGGESQDNDSHIKL